MQARKKRGVDLEIKINEAGLALDPEITKIN